MKAPRANAAEVVVFAGVGRSTLGRISVQDLGEHPRTCHEPEA